MSITRNGNYPPSNGDQNRGWENDPSKKIKRTEAGINLITADVVTITTELVSTELRKLDQELREMLDTQELFEIKTAYHDPQNNNSEGNDRLQAELLGEVLEYMTVINQAKIYINTKNIQWSFDTNTNQTKQSPSNENSEYNFDNDDFIKEMQSYFEIVSSVYKTPPIFSKLSRLNFVKGEFNYSLIESKNKILITYMELSKIINKLIEEKLSKSSLSISAKRDLDELNKMTNDLMLNYLAGDGDLLEDTLEFYLKSKSGPEENHSQFIQALERLIKYNNDQKTKIRTALILTNTGHVSKLNLTREFLAEVRFWRSRIEAEKRQFYVQSAQNNLIGNKNKLKLVHNEIKNGLLFHFLDKNKLSSLISTKEEFSCSSFEAYLDEIREYIDKFNRKMQFSGSGVISIIKDQSSLKNWTIDGNLGNCIVNVEVFRQFNENIVEQVCRVNLMDNQNDFLSLVMTQSSVYLEFGLRSDFSNRVSVEVSYFDECVDYFLQIISQTEFSFSRFNSNKIEFHDSEAA